MQQAANIYDREKAVQTVNKLVQSINYHKINLIQLFSTFDYSKDQQLSIQEFSQLLLKIDPYLTNIDINLAFALFDHDQSGTITYQEFQYTLNNFMQGNFVKIPTNPNQFQQQQQNQQTNYLQQQQQQIIQPQDQQMFQQYPVQNGYQQQQMLTQQQQLQQQPQMVGAINQQYNSNQQFIQNMNQKYIPPIIPQQQIPYYSKDKKGKKKDKKKKKDKGDDDDDDSDFEINLETIQEDIAMGIVEGVFGNCCQKKKNKNKKKYK